MEPAWWPPLAELWTEAQRRGWIGPGPLVETRDHALALLVGLAPYESAADLGSGGGVPGLVGALSVPTSRWTLIESSSARAAFLERTCRTLGLAGRVAVVHARAETAGRGPLRSTFDLVTSRSFGPPAATVECAAPLLRQNGIVVVADPPDAETDRWPVAALAALGLEPLSVPAGAVSRSVLRLVAPVPDELPRRPGVPHRRPLF